MAPYKNLHSLATRREVSTTEYGSSGRYKSWRRWLIMLEIAVTSRFGWIDFAEDDRRQMLDILKLFAVRDTRDELGIGTVRDAFANYFFPGTTTIQTRARYFLLVPWVYLEAERRGRSKAWSASRFADEVDGIERALIGSLKRGGADEGVIGGRAGKQVERLPSSVYWPGLGALQIRLFSGSQAELTRRLGRASNRGDDSVRLHPAERDQEADTREIPIWQAHLPPAPSSFLSECNLNLTQPEADYLRERIRFSHPQSLFAAFLAADSRRLDQTFFWEHPLCHELDGDLPRAIEAARRFSLLIHGASYMYNLMLAEKWQVEFGEDQDDRQTRFRELIQTWSGEVSKEWSQLQAWCLTPDELWSSPGLRNWSAIPQTRRFIDRWMQLLASCRVPEDIIGQRGARELIREREYYLKQANRARLVNRDALRRWSGAAGTGRLDYRWGITSTLLSDIWDGMSPLEVS